MLWTLLMPSMLANMAGWMARSRVKSGEEEATQEPTTWIFRWFARLAALVLTLHAAVIVTILSLDTFAYQCLGQLQCSRRLVAASWLPALNFLHERPGIRLALGVIVPVAVALLFFVLACRSRTRYERVEPPTPFRTLPAPGVRCAAAQKGGLRSAQFWSGWLWHKHLSDLHLAASVAVPTGTLGWCVSELGERMNLPANSPMVVARLATAASIVVVLIIVGMLATDAAHEYFARGTLIFSGVFLFITSVAAWTLPLELVQADDGGAKTVLQPVGVAPGIESVTVSWGLALLLLFPLVVQQVTAWGARWWKAAKEARRRGDFEGRRAELKWVRAKARGTLKVFPFAAPVVLNVVALILGNAVLLSLMMLAAGGLGEVSYGFRPERGVLEPTVGPALWVPKAVMSIASVLALGVIVVLGLFGVAVWIWLAAKSKAKASSLVDELRTAYDEAEMRSGSLTRAPAKAATAQERRDAWTVSAFEPAPFDHSRSALARATKSRPSKWVRQAARACLIGEYTPNLAAILAITVSAVGVLGTLLVVTQIWDPQTWVAELVTWLSVLLPVSYVAALRLMFRNERVRRAMMSPFDVGTFFPRSFHPFAPPSYTERAVPELTRRIWWLHDFGGRVVLTAHSQGSALTAAVLARQSERTEENPVGLVTLGSPLAKLYRWAFPALFSDGLLQSFAKGHGGFGDIHWRNVFYATDYIGGPVATKAWSASLRKIDMSMIDPMTDKFVFGQPLPNILSHTGYWVDPRFWREVEKMCDIVAPYHFRATDTGAHSVSYGDSAGMSLSRPPVNGSPSNIGDDEEASLATIAPDSTTPLPYQ
ncbi:hypothetical protein [Arthrobacter sp. HMWF013]|uniref:hypothetical protein n=1 Tax=Arthrobacter sp. HMWF013 TaxID=2056849 RepID=UPI0015E7F3E0|nr:hypothetical protein [Arthrobacter sp. HMWF013]